MADTLTLWHPAQHIPVPAGYLDWGPIAPRTSADIEFRIRNESTLYTATGIVVSLSDVGSATPRVAAQHLLSADRLRFTDHLQLGTLGPASTTGRLVLRRVTVADADVGTFTFTLLVQASAWQ